MYDFHVKKLSDVLTFSGYSKYGRAALGGMRNTSETGGRDLMTLLKRKLSLTLGDKRFKDASTVAVLSYLVCFAVQSYNPLAQELVASFMMNRNGISADRHALNLRSVPEPTLAMAAREIVKSLTWPVVIERAAERAITDIDVGAQGELAAQILIIMATQEAEKKGATSQFFGAEDFPIIPVSSFDFLTSLGVRESFVESPDHWKIYRAWRDRLDRSFVRGVQFSKNYASFTAEYLQGRFFRANGIICKPLYQGIDGMLPLLVLDDPISSARAMNKAPIDKGRFSHVGLQFKNRESALSDSRYEQLATTSMYSEIVLGDGVGDYNEELFYLSIVLDVGPS